MVGHPVTLALPRAVDDEVATASRAVEDPIRPPVPRRSPRGWGRVPRPDGGRVAGGKRRFAHVVDARTRRGSVRHRLPRRPLGWRGRDPASLRACGQSRSPGLPRTMGATVQSGSDRLRAPDTPQAHPSLRLVVPAAAGSSPVLTLSVGARDDRVDAVAVGVVHGASPSPTRQRTEMPCSSRRRSPSGPSAPRACARRRHAPARRLPRSCGRDGRAGRASPSPCQRFAACIGIGDAEGVGEVLPELVRGAHLQRLAVAHQALARPGDDGAGELLALRLAAAPRGSRRPAPSSPRMRARGSPARTRAPPRPWRGRCGPPATGTPCFAETGAGAAPSARRSPTG